MQINVIASGFLTTPSLKDYLNRRIDFAFSSARHKIGLVSIRLRDLNGPHGGRDKMCHISVLIPGRIAVVVKDVEADIYAAIDGAVKRAAYRANRILKQQRERTRQASAAMTDGAPDGSVQAPAA